MKSIVIAVVLLFVSSLSADTLGFGLQATWMPPIPEGPMNGSSIGRSTAIVGDINGDNFVDLAIAAEMAADTATGAIPGKVYIFLGREGAPLSLLELPDIILQGEEHQDWFGYTISGGDFNGDDYSDIIVISQGWWRANYPGKLYLYLGSETIDDIPDLTFSPQTNERFWNQGPTTFVGDINGDGYDDIASPISSGGAGHVLLFYGGSDPDLVPDDTLIMGVGYRPRVGYGGDINGDGIDDLLVGDRYTADDSGKVHIFLGGDPFPNTPDTVITGNYNRHWFGRNLAILGDINADGFDDFGIAGALEGASSLYGCHVYYGSEDGIYEEVALLYDASQDDYGNALLGAGDINFDGYDDFIVGAPGMIGGWDPTPGHVHIYYGDSLPPDTTDVFLVGEAANDQYGYAIAAGGDLNNDGYDDVAIGAYKSSIEGYYCGKVYVHSGKMLRMNNFDPQVEISGQPTREWVGLVVAAGDINGDGINDIAFTHNIAILHELGSGGNVYLCLGKEEGGKAIRDMEPDFILTDSTVLFGHSIAFGDFDGDGYDDLAIGSPWWSDPNDPFNRNIAGEVCIYFGSPYFYPIPGLILHGTSNYKAFGASLDFIGDLNGDGSDELLVGAPEVLQRWRSCGKADSVGYAYLYFGAGESIPERGDTLPDAIYRGEEPKGGFGYSVIGTGDMTGDGIPDYAISAYYIGWSSGGFGKVYVYEGNPTPTALPIATYEDYSYEWIGHTLGAPGDVNNDGYADLLAACRSREWGPAGSYGNGTVRVYLGGDPMPSAEYCEIYAPEGCSAGFGIGIGNVGDVNLDGFPDFAIGAPQGIPGEWITYGAISIMGHGPGDYVYIYYGGDSFDCFHDGVLEPPTEYGMFGYTITYAGVTSSQDSGCFIIGAPGTSLSGYETGKLYVYNLDTSPIAERASKPDELTITSYPNPFNSSVTISVRGSSPTIEIYDINGRMVGLFSEPNTEHRTPITVTRDLWDGTDMSGNELPSGVYFVKAYSSIGKAISHKIVLIK